MARIASLHFYPVKSCRGITVDALRMSETGPEWDRRWMIVKPGGLFITQRTHPAMATIAVALEGRLLRLTAPGRAPLEVPGDHDGPSGPVVVWKSECLVIDAGDEAAAWLSAVLGEPLRLVRQDPARPRFANPDYAGPDPHPVSFADAYPVLLISRASLEDLNTRLPEPIPMTRFRPNIVVEGIPAYAEDTMTRFRAGPVVLRGIKRCDRCSITTTDQLTGARHPEQEPIRTLKAYRYDCRLKGVVFGQNCLVESGVGERLAVGDEFAIT
ncbi:MAG TPA: MOSC N-terminal beta barrel domain-containing protein [Steroidobacteraceae bacterium]|nr:MOSC N-terminal beta barrel domain-containing protein [Steroidobacteraceae bacterium]